MASSPGATGSVPRAGVSRMSRSPRWSRSNTRPASEPPIATAAADQKVTTSGSSVPRRAGCVSGTVIARCRSFSRQVRRPITSDTHRCAPSQDAAAASPLPGRPRHSWIACAYPEMVSRKSALPRTVSEAPGADRPESRHIAASSAPRSSTVAAASSPQPASGRDTATAAATIIRSIGGSSRRAARTVSMWWVSPSRRTNSAGSLPRTAIATSGGVPGWRSRTSNRSAALARFRCTPAPPRPRLRVAASSSSSCSGETFPWRRACTPAAHVHMAATAASAPAKRDSTRSRSAGSRRSSTAHAARANRAASARRVTVAPRSVSAPSAPCPVRWRSRWSPAAARMGP